jgi:hypothetical protein
MMMLDVFSYYFLKKACVVKKKDPHFLYAEFVYVSSHQCRRLNEVNAIDTNKLI